LIHAQLLLCSCLFSRCFPVFRVVFVALVVYYGQLRTFGVSVLTSRGFGSLAVSRKCSQDLLLTLPLSATVLSDTRSTAVIHRCVLTPYCCAYKFTVYQLCKVPVPRLCDSVAGAYSVTAERFISIYVITDQCTV